MKIGITGKMVSGKTTLAEYLVREHGFTRVSLADPIKELESIQAHVPDALVTQKLRPIINNLVEKKQRHELEKWLMETFAKYPKMPGEKNRDLLQTLGHQARERYGNGIWVNYALKRSKQYDNVVIDDMRYQNEALLLRSSGFSIWRIEISKDTQRRRLLSIYGPQMLEFTDHPSETNLDTGWDLFDHVINGDDSPKELFEAARRILEDAA